MLRPSSCAPSSSFIAVSASASFSYVTKPKPLERPVSRSRMTLASATGPNCWKASKSDASSVAHASPPTKSFLDNSRLVAPPKRSLGGFVEGPPAEIGPRQDCFGHDVNGIASATAVPALRARQDRHWSPLRAPPGDFGVQRGRDARISSARCEMELRPGSPNRRPRVATTTDGCQRRAEGVRKGHLRLALGPCWARARVGSVTTWASAGRPHRSDWARPVISEVPQPQNFLMPGLRRASSATRCQPSP